MYLANREFWDDAQKRGLVLSSSIRDEEMRLYETQYSFSGLYYVEYERLLKTGDYDRCDFYIALSLTKELNVLRYIVSSVSLCTILNLRAE